MAAAAVHTLLQGAASPMACLVGTTITAPLILPSPAAAPAAYTAVVLSAEVAVADGTCTLASGSTTHVSTRFAAAVGAAASLEPLQAQRSSSLTTILSSSRPAVASSHHGAAVGKVRQPAAQLPVEFILNPAVLDCCLQLGGAVPAAQQKKQAGTTYIPATLAALALRASIGRASATALAQRPAGAPDTDAAVLRNHCIVGAAGSLVCQLEGLESRATGGRARGTAGAAGTAQQAASDMLYEISWAAADAQAATQALASSAAGVLALASSRVQLAASSIAVVQGTLATASASLQLQTFGRDAVHAVPAGASGNGAAGQLWGLLRTVAAECQTLAVGGADSAAAAASSNGSAAQLIVGGTPSLQPFDGYGSAASGGSRYLPLMQPSAARSTPAPFQLLPQPRGALQNLAPVSMDSSAAVGPGQVMLEVKAVGINFRCAAGCGT